MFTNTLGNNNIANGYQAMFSNTTGNFNIANGYRSLNNNLTGFSNIAFGTESLYNNKYGNNNIAIGYQSLINNLSASHNIALGYQALHTNQRGENNIAIGNISVFSGLAANNNIGIGYGALNNNGTGQNNTAIGHLAGAYAPNYSNYTYLGANVSTATNNNQVKLGDGNITAVVSQVGSWSDERDKADIRDTVLGLDFINKIRAVDYKWDYREDYRSQPPNKKNFETDESYIQALHSWIQENKLSNITKDGSKKRIRYHHGVIAQQIKEVIQDIGEDFGGFQDHSFNGGDEAMTIGYFEFIGPMIKAIQELNIKVEEQKQKILNLEQKYGTIN